MTDPTSLPHWPNQTIGVLVTTAGEPHAIPVSAPVRANDRTILLSLHRDRGSLARLRHSPRVAVVILTAGDIAITARGTARILQEPMQDAPDYTAVEIAVSDIDDHRQAEFVVEAGVGRHWVDQAQQRALGARVAALRQLATASASAPTSLPPEETASTTSPKAKLTAMATDATED